MRRSSFLCLIQLTCVLIIMSGVIASSGSAFAQDATKPKAVVELFTSQGCSSCPPADKLLAKLAKRDDIIALTMPVDYWDYLGWKDTLAKSQFSNRQRSYARTRGDRQVYTPQVVVNGVVHAVGSRAYEVDTAINKSRRELAKRLVPVSMRLKDKKIIIQLGSAPEALEVRKGKLWLAVIEQKINVSIERGENHGKQITYSNVVRSLKPIGEWSGKSTTLQFDKSDFMVKGSDGCTILLQQGNSGPIIGAAELKSWL